MVLDEVLWAEKADPYLDYMSNPVRMKYYSTSGGPDVINLPPSSCLASLKAQHWSLLLTGQTLSSSSSYAGLGERVQVVGSMHPSISTTMAVPSISLLCENLSGH